MWSEKGRRAEREKGAVKESTREKEVGEYIPEGSMYDEEPVRREIGEKQGVRSYRSVTVFGYTAENMEHVMKKFEEFGEMEGISHGKNWVDIEYKREKSMFQAMQESGSIINGEMIGVAQRARKSICVDTVEKSMLFAEKREGMISKVLTYLFG